VTARRSVLAVLAVGALAVPLAAQIQPLVETFDAAWRIVRDTHFDPAMNGVDWNAVRTELRPRAADASSSGELRGVIREMLGRLGQSHFVVIPGSVESTRDGVGDRSGDPGFDVRLVGHDVLVTSVDPQGGGAAAGVRPGWRLVSIDGKTISTLVEAFSRDTAERVVQVETWRAVENRLRGPQDSSAALVFEDGAGRTVSRAVERRREPGEPVTIGNLPTMHVRVDAEPHRTSGGRTAGVIRFNVWMPAVDAQFQRAIDELRASDGIVLDLRGNPGGLAAMLMGISGHFIRDRTPLGIMKTRDSELRFVANPRLVSASGERVEPFAGPVAILLDTLSGSATECFAGGMQSIGRARVFGQTSMGQALPALFDKLPNGDLLIHAYGDFVTATGKRLEGVGVVPDVPVPIRREDLLANKDATLQAALEWIDRARTTGGAQ
jgi:carboxyl-terminal processing protease